MTYIKILKMKLASLLLGLGLLSAIALPGRAEEPIKSGKCQFNQTLTMECTTKSNGGTFSIKWADGLSDTYRWVGSNADRINLVDARGGVWHYSDARNCRDFKITNVENKNSIAFRGHAKACE